MEWTFVRAFCCVVSLAACSLLPISASAITLSYEYSGTGNISFQSEAIVSLGGNCVSPCALSALLTISGTGPVRGPTSGWASQAFANVIDNFGDSLQLAVNTGNVGTNNFRDGGVFFPAALPSSLDISTSSLASIFGGSGTIDYSLSISLPAGAYVTPLPESLPLFLTGLGLLGLLGWRASRGTRGKLLPDR